MKAKHVLKGLLSYVPGVIDLLPQWRGTGGTVSAQYCYGVWFKHLTMLRESGLHSVPHTMAELGPGDSIGVGLAAMLSGVDKYCALDVVRFSNATRNLKIFDELVALFRDRGPRPEKGWPDFDHYLDGRLFPSHILTEAVLRRSLADERVAAIRDAIAHPDQARSVSIQYLVPWSDPSVIKRGTVDLIVSHSVLEHVEDLEKTYAALAAWLKPNGIMSHQIDMTSHGVSDKWNGYRAYSEPLWKLMLGKRPFFINRQPRSRHVEEMLKNNFELVCELRSYRMDGVSREELSSRWRALSDDDLTCSGLFVQARKRMVSDQSTRAPS